MNNNVDNYKFSNWSNLLRDNRKSILLKQLSGAQSIEIANFLAKQESHITILGILLQLPNKLISRIFVNFNTELQLKLYKLWGKKNFARIFSIMPSQHRADFYKILNKKEKAKIFPLLNKEIQKNIISLSSYEENTVGSCMSTDFTFITGEMRVKTVLKKLREESSTKNLVYYLYVVNESMELIGFISIKNLVSNQLNTKVLNIMNVNYISANCHINKKDAAQLIETYNLIAIPILNNKKQIVGILRYDDAMDIIRSEETEEIEKMMGITNYEEEANYATISAFSHFKKRAFWIIGLFVTSFISELIIHANSFILDKITILSLYLPMITAVGGNVGSQAATMVIRALSLEQVFLKDWLKIVYKELKVSLILSFCLFFIAFLKVILLSKDLEANFALKLAFNVSIAISLQVIGSILIGSTLPLVAKYFKGDPVVIASPAITTLVDITGVLIYFTVSYQLLF